MLKLLVCPIVIKKFTSLMVLCKCNLKKEVGSVSHLKMYTDDLLMSSVSRIQTLMIY